jgi:hypothetical protein
MKELTAKANYYQENTDFCDLSCDVLNQHLKLNAVA